MHAAENRGNGQALDTTVVRPPFDIVRAAHAELVVTDLGRARRFYVDLLGFEPTEETSDALYLRGYEERLHHSLVLRRGPQPVLGHLAFRVASQADVEALADWFAALGCPVRWVGEDEEAGQGPGPALRVEDPLGFPIEFFFDMSRAECLLQQFERHRGGHMMRLDHFNIHVPDAAVGYEHYRRLGFRCSEYIETEGDGRLAAAWVFRKPTVHDIAFTTGFGPRLHHLGFTAADSVSILRLCDVLAGAKQDAAIERGPGRHGVSNAFFLYLRDPDGHRIELYTGDYYTGDPDLEPIRWSSADPRRRTFWGHAVPASWYEEGSSVRRLDGSVAALQEPVLSEVAYEVASVAH